MIQGNQGRNQRELDGSTMRIVENHEAGNFIERPHTSELVRVRDSGYKRQKVTNRQSSKTPSKNNILLLRNQANATASGFILNKGGASNNVELSNHFSSRVSISRGSQRMMRSAELIEPL